MNITVSCELWECGSLQSTRGDSLLELFHKCFVVAFCNMLPPSEYCFKNFEVKSGRIILQSLENV